MICIGVRRNFLVNVIWGSSKNRANAVYGCVILVMGYGTDGWQFETSENMIHIVFDFQSMKEYRSIKMDTFNIGKQCLMSYCFF